MPHDRLRITFVVLATAHLNHDTRDNRPENLAALWQRCHMMHDRPEYQRRRQFILRARKTSTTYSAEFMLGCNTSAQICVNIFNRSQVFERIFYSAYRRHF